MKKLRNISVIGLGAIGAAYAGKLYDMDPDSVRVIADGERIERYNRSGITINGKSYNFNFVRPDEEGAAADLILVAVKFDNLSQAIKDMKNHVGHDTIILSLMNGISSEEKIGGEYGMDRMLYGVCVGIDAQRQGTDISFSNFGYVTFGERDNTTYSPNVQAVKELFDIAGIPYEIPDDMMHSLWWKFMVNVGINQASAVLKAPYGVFQQDEEAWGIVESAMKEVISLSNKIGVNLNEDGIEEFRRIVGTLSPRGKTSMLQDVEAGRKTEVEMFAGTVCEMGNKYGVDTPVNSMLLKMIHTLERMS